MTESFFMPAERCKSLSNEGWKDIIRKWKGEGRGKSNDLVGDFSTVISIRPIYAGGIVFGSTKPAFGVFDASDRLVVYKRPAIADLSDNWEGFLVSYDGSTVQFGYEIFGKSPAKFSVSERLLELNPGPSGLQILTPPVTSATGLNITDWEDTYQPKLNGRALKLEQYELSRSLAVSSATMTFLVGADWHVYLFDRNGKEIWSVPVPGVAWGVNISGDGKLAVAALGDGTIRWYRMKDGKELLGVLFPITTGNAGSYGRPPVITLPLPAPRSSSAGT